MDERNYSRRKFVRQNAKAGLGAMFASSITPSLFAHNVKTSTKPAILGGTPAHSGGWTEWPIWKPETDEKLVLEVLRSGVWSRAELVTKFEEEWAKTVDAKRALAVVNGTNALIAAMVQAGIGGGDEVIVSSYTFIASAASILATGAIPIFVDSDPKTFQIDPAKIEEKITSRTAAIMPVHILGLPADMNAIMKIARKRDLVVIEDACQGWLAEIDNKKVGTFGKAGCFSFQNSKNMAIGEGGAIVSNDEDFMDRCYSYHNYGNPYGAAVGEVGSGTVIAGTKLRITEYQAAIGLAQLKRLEQETVKRGENAAYLSSLIKTIPGIIPYKLYDSVTRAAFHLFPFRYQKEEFNGLSRELFLKALNAEGIKSSGGYAPLNKMPYLDNAFKSKNFRLMYPPELLDYHTWLERNQCPITDRLCDEEGIWLYQNMLLNEKSDMDDIAEAIEKIQKHSGEIKKAMG